MIREDQTNQIRDLLSVKQTALVILTPEATLDQAASASALVLSLQAAGKTVVFASPIELPQFNHLAGMDQLQTQIGNQDLTVSFPYQVEKVDKVSYHIDENSQKFYLVIKPQKGQKPLDPSTVEYSYTGADADLIFLVGVHDFESLDQLYFGYESLYENVPVITFHTFTPEIGSIKIDASGSSAQSEAMAGFLFGIDTPPNGEAASNLLLGIEEVTDSFRSLAMTAETFEMVAYLLRQGARRAARPKPSLSNKPAIQLNQNPNSNQFASALQVKPPTESNPKNNQKSSQPNQSKKQKQKPGNLHHQPSGFSPSGGG